MKALFITIVFWMGLSSSLLFSQPQQSNVTTPKGSTVVAYKPNEMLATDRAYWDNYFSQSYPTATKILTYGSYSSSNRFNCHGYAWYMVENSLGLSDPRWIGYYYTTDEDIYMTDGSYVQVATEMYPGKVSWGSGDHSAVTTNQPGIYVSKWNKYPLFRHSWNNTPFGTSNLKYYVSTAINGAELICGGAMGSFSTANITGASYLWTVGPGLSINSNGGYNTTVTASTSYNGPSWVEVKITSPLGNGTNDVKTSKRKTIWIGAPVVQSIQGPTYVQQNVYYIYYAEPINTNSNATYYWYIYPGGSSYTSTTNSKDIVFSNAGWNSLVIASQNACGWGFDEPNLEVYVSGSSYFTLSPNPASDFVEVQLTEDNIFKPQSGKNKPLYSIVIYDSFGEPFYEVKNIEINKTIKIPTSKLKDGIYVINITDGVEIYHNRLVVKH